MLRVAYVQCGNSTTECLAGVKKIHLHREPETLLQSNCSHSNSVAVFAAVGENQVQNLKITLNPEA